MREETIAMPKLGLTMESGTIAQILRKPGDLVKEGETILEFETEKLQEAIVAPFDGYVKEILVEEGQELAIAEPLVVFADEM